MSKETSKPMLKEEPVLKEDLKGLRRFKADSIWFGENYETLKKQYANEQDQFIAVNDKKVIDHDYNLDKLIERLKKQFGRDTLGSLLIKLVTKEKITYVFPEQIR